VKGKKITFTGAFSVLDPSSVLVTPVTLEVAP
jgi:predicted lipoprotein